MVMVRSLLNRANREQFCSRQSCSVSLSPGRGVTALEITVLMLDMMYSRTLYLSGQCGPRGTRNCENARNFEKGVCAPAPVNVMAIIIH